MIIAIPLANKYYSMCKLILNRSRTDQEIFHANGVNVIFIYGSIYGSIFGILFLGIFTNKIRAKLIFGIFGIYGMYPLIHPPLFLPPHTYTCGGEGRGMTV